MFVTADDDLGVTTVANLVLKIALMHKRGRNAHSAAVLLILAPDLLLALALTTKHVQELDALVVLQCSLELRWE